MEKYADYTYTDDTVEFKPLEEIKEMFECLKPIDKSPSHWNSLRNLNSDKFRTLAFTGGVRYAYYNEEEDIIVKDTEGDIMVVVNPTEEYINDLLSYYPKSEVCAEEYDERFDREVEA